MSKTPQKHPDLEAAEAFGLDLTQLDYMLSLTPTQRVEHMERLANELTAIRAATAHFRSSSST
ncbi:MAG: hypothetical protein AAF730_02275 [Bacteroidota bacterium]